MKTYFTLLLSLMTIAIYSQSQSYTASTEIFANPERGFYHYQSTGTTGYTALSQSTISAYRTGADKITLVWREFNLAQFRTTAISATYLTKMQTDFSALRAAGVKAIVRFSYGDESNDATKTQMLAHIAQVKPVLAANEDVISSIEAGFIGGYGEWYYSDNFGTDNLTTKNLSDRLEVGLAIMDMVPSRMVAFRTPVIQKQIAGTTPVASTAAFDGSVKSRAAAHNDCFLSSSDDYGTYTGSSDYTYLEGQSKYTFGGGETCSLTSYSACANAMTQMARFHFNYLNTDYNQTVINNWKTNNCIDDVKRKLGYRFEMLSSNIAGSTFTLTLQNVGYGNVINDRNAYLIMINTSTSQSYSFLLNTNVRQWNAGAQATITQNLSTLGLPNGTYQMYINAPDKTLGTNPAYSIQFANTGVWDAESGYNNLNRTFTVTGSTGGDTTGGTTTGGTTTGGTTTGGTTTLAVQIILGPNSIIQVANLPSTTYTVKVYNTTGRLKSTSMNISNLKKGTYIVKLTCNGITYTQQVLKVNPIGS